MQISGGTPCFVKRNNTKIRGIKLRQAVKLLNKPNLFITNVATRICYDSFHKVGVKGIGEYVNRHDMLDDDVSIKVAGRLGHESVIEHTYVSFIVITNRAVLQQLVRHRLCSFSVQSTRYTLKRVLNKNDLHRVIIPFSKESKEISINALQTIKQLITEEKRNDDIKDVIPETLLTKLVISMNLRQFKHFIELRTSQKAWLPIREIAYMMLEKVYKHEPELVDYIKIAPEQIKVELQTIRKQLYGWGDK